ncbi:MAG: DUF2461 domain-containing protein [Alphaproteobacteria bacterium]
MSVSSTFSGFDPALIKFYKALKKNNSKTWFEAHRADYDALHLEPAKDFVAALAPGLSKISPDIIAVPTVGGTIGRINRDTRFSKDKTPYKHNMFLRLRQPAQGMKEGPGTFVHIGIDGLWLAGGWFRFDTGPRDAYRAAIIDDKKGPALLRAVKKVEKAGFEGPGGTHYKRVPRGFDPDHKRAEFLKHSGFYMTRHIPGSSPLFSADAVPFMLEQVKAFQPVIRWLQAHASA